MSEPIREAELKGIEQQLEDKYGIIYPEDISSDENGVYQVNEYDSGNPSDEGYSVYKKKMYFDDKDIPLLETIKVI